MIRALVVAIVLVLVGGSTAFAQGSIDTEAVYLGAYGGTICKKYSGSGAPSGGATCDEYVDTATGNIYTKRAGTWTMIPRTEISNTWAASQTVTGTMTATTFSGSGASLTNVPGSSLTGAASVSDAVLSANIPRLATGNSFTAKNLITVNGEALQIQPATSTSATYQRTNNGSENLLFGVESSTGGTIFSGTNAYAGVFGVQGAHDLAFATNNTMRLQIDSSGNLLPYVTSAYNIGSPTRLWNRAYFATIDATLFAKSTQTIYGGWLSVNKNAGTFAVAVASANTTIDFGQAMVANQFVVVRGTDTGGSVTEEYIKVLTLSAGTVYNVTRNLSGGGAKNWAKGTPYATRGVAGDGWLELNAFDTPRMSVFTQGSAYNNSVENLRIGHLTGMPNSVTGIGFYVGATAAHLYYSPTDGFDLQASAVKINSTTGITLGPGPSAYDSTTSLKFNRESSWVAGANDVFGVWTQSLGGSYQDIYIENSANRGATGPAKASVYLRSQGWDGVSAFTTAAQLRVRSEIGVSAIEMTADNVSTTGALTVNGTTSTAFSMASGAFTIHGTSGKLTLSPVSSNVPILISQSSATNANAFYIDVQRTNNVGATGALRFQGSAGAGFQVGVNQTIGTNALEFNTNTPTNLGYFTTTSFFIAVPETITAASGVGLTLSQALTTNANALYIDVTRTDSTTPIGELRFNSSSGQKWGIGTNIRVGGTALEFNTGSVNLGYFTTSLFNLDGSVDLQIPKRASSTGQRFLCITTTGLVVSSASACVGT